MHDVLEHADVPEKIADISDIGWGLNKVADDSAVGMPRDAAKRKVMEDINNKLSEVSDLLLPPVVPWNGINPSDCMSSHIGWPVVCKLRYRMRYRSHKRKRYHAQVCNH